MIIKGQKGPVWQAFRLNITRGRIGPLPQSVHLLTPNYDFLNGAK